MTGVVDRKEEYRTPKRWYEWVPDTKRSQGRPRKRWDQNVDEALKKQGTSLNDVRAQETYLDQDKWRKLVADRSLGLPGDG